MSVDIPAQEAAQTETKQKKRGGTWLLILLIIFIILFLLTSIILGARLYRQATRDRYAVDLGVGTGGELELFKIEYSNEAGEITVQGANGQNVIAPGTAVDYDINLRNRDDVTINYLLTPQVTYLTDDPIPMQVKLSDHYGNYLLAAIPNGSAWMRSTVLRTRVPSTRAKSLHTTCPGSGCSKRTVKAIPTILTSATATAHPVLRSRC